MHVSTCYRLIAVKRHLDTLHEPSLGSALVRVLLLVVTVAAICGAVGVGLVSLRAWRRSRQRDFSAAFTAIVSCVVVLYLVWAIVLVSAVNL